MRGHQDKESHWIHVMRLKIYTEKSLGCERSNSLGLSVVLPFARFLLPGVRVAICSCGCFSVTHNGLSKRDTTSSLLHVDFMRTHDHRDALLTYDRLKC